VLKPDGSKFGKSESGTVWLDRRRTSPYAFFQFWLRTGDAQVGTYLRRLTLLGRAEITELDRAVVEHPERREAQRALARAVTTMVHGAAETERVERAAAVLFTEDLARLDVETMAQVLDDAPSTPVSGGDLAGGWPLVDALVRAGLVSSRGAARRHIAQGAVYVNNRKVTEDRPLTAADALHGRFVLLRRGKAAQHVLAVRGAQER
jgi:tyrosyl-tRNA synthetase